MGKKRSQLLYEEENKRERGGKVKNGKERIIMEEEKGSSEGKQEVTGFLVERTIGKGEKKE